MNGRFVREADARISIYDSALATGEVVVEVTRTFNHSLFRLREHLHRLYTGLKEMHIEPGITIAQMEKITQLTLTRNTGSAPSDIDWQIIHYISRGPAGVFAMFPQNMLRPTVIIQCVPLLRRQGKMAATYRNGVDLVVPHQRAIPADILSPQIKSRGRLDYILARIQAKAMKPGATGVLLDADGFLTEGTGTSLFLVSDGVVKTAPSRKVLNGITRDLVFELAHKLAIPISEVDLRLSDARRATEMLLTSTVICLVHARSFKGRLIGDGTIGPVTARIREAFMHKVGLDFVAQAQRYERFLAREPDYDTIRI